jgi:hypothetical protein
MGNIRCEVLRTYFLKCSLDTVTVTATTYSFKWTITCNGVLHLGLHYVGMFRTKFLNLFGEDFVSNPDDDVFQPPNYSSVPVLLQHELVSAFKQRNTAEMTVMIGKMCIRRCLVGKVGKGGSLMVTDVLRTPEDTDGENGDTQLANKQTGLHTLRIRSLKYSDHKMLR